MNITQHIAPARRCRGIAMILVMFAVAIVVVLAVSFVSEQETAIGITQNARDHLQARTIAESGLTMAVDHVRATADWRNNVTNGAWLTDHSFGGGTISVSGVDGIDLNGDGIIDSDGDLLDDVTEPLTITVVGRYRNVTHRVRAEIWPELLGNALRVLMIVPDPSALLPDDLARRNLVKSFGMSVTIMDDDASQSAIDEAVLNHDVVYVSKNASPVALANKLDGVTIGVVTEQRDFAVDLGLGLSTGTFSGSLINITDTSHYITETLPAGELGITDSTQPLLTLGGVMPPGARVLGNRPSVLTPSLVAIDAGQATLTGTAIARRVSLPWGDSGFDIASLTDDGKTILERSLQWSGAPISVTPNDVGLGVTERLYLQDSGVVDSWNSGLGPYSDTNRSSEAIISTNATSSAMLRVLNAAVLKGSLYVGPGGNPGTVASIASTATVTGSIGTLDEVVPMPDNSIPAGMPASEGDVTFSGGTTVITGKRRFNRLNLRYDAVVRIEGETMIVCDHSFNMFENSQVQLADGATLKVWGHSSNDAIHFEGNARFNMNTWDPSRATMYVVGGGEFDMDDAPQVCARVIAPHGYLDVNDDTQFYGTFLGQKIVVEQRGRLHHDKRISPYPDTDPYDEHDGTPQLILEYKFEEPPAPVPQLISYWQLDETAGLGGGLAAGGKLSVITGAQVDSYRSAEGPYGGANIGSDALIATNSTASGTIKIDATPTIVRGHAYVGPGGNPSTVISGIGSITGQTGAMDQPLVLGGYAAPTGMPAAGGTLSVTSNQTWSSDLHYDKIDISAGTVTISGNVRVLCDNEFRMRQGARLVVPPGSSLTLYAIYHIRIENDAVLNPDTTGAARVRAYVLNGGGDIIIETRAVACGRFFSAGKGYLKTDAHLYGSLIAVNEIKCETASRYHTDVSLADMGIAPPTAEDAAGAADGVYRNGTTLGQTGAVNRAARFDGVNDHITIPHHDALRLDAGTVALWFKADNTSLRGDLFSKEATGRGTGGHLGVYVEAGQIKARLQSASADYTVAGGSVVAGQWHHVAFSWGPAGMKLFRDGQLVGSNAYAGGLGTTSGGAGNSEPMVIGANAAASGAGLTTPLSNYFAGLIDDVRIYDAAFTAPQVASVMAGLDPGTGDAVGARVIDTSGFGAAVDLDIENTGRIQWHDGGGLTFLDATRAISPGPASKLYDELTRTGAFTLELKFSTADITQSGPAQIFSYALGSANRNLSVGQHADAATLRLTTDSTSSDGLPEVVAASGLSTGVMEHLIITYDGEALRVYRNGTLVATDPRNDDLDWTAGDLLALGDEVTGSRPWLGTLRRVAVYNRALGASQVTNVYRGGAPGDGSVVRPFRVRWREVR